MMTCLKWYLDPFSLHQVKINVAKVGHPLSKPSVLAHGVSLVETGGCIERAF